MKIFEPCKQHTLDKFKEMQNDYQQHNGVFDYIIEHDGSFLFQKYGLSKALYCLEAIDKVARLNYTLKHLGVEPIDTSIFYKVLQTITEDTPIMDAIVEDYFMKMKELYKISDGFWVLSDDLCFIPNSDLDMYVLGIDLNNKELDIFAELLYDFREGNIPLKNFIKSARNITTAPDTATPYLIAQ